MAAIGVTAGVGAGRAVGVGGGFHRRSSVPVGVPRRLAPDSGARAQFSPESRSVRAPHHPSRPPARRGWCTESDERVDPWFWLRDRDDPEVHRVPRGRERLHARRARAPRVAAGASSSTRSSAACRRPTPPRRSAAARCEYFTRTRRGPPVRRALPSPGDGGPLPDPLAAPGTPDGELVVLDENALAAGHDYFAVGDLAVDPDADASPAYSTDTSGGERYDAALPRRSTTSGRRPTSTTSSPDVYYGVAWANDGATIFYARPDDAMRPWQVWRHTLGTAADDDVLVFQEDDDRFYVGVGRTRSGRFLVITIGSKVTSEVWLVDADAPDRAAVGRRAARAGARVPRRAPRGPGRRPPLRPHQRRRRRELRARGHAGRAPGPRVVDDRAPAPRRHPPRRRRRVRRLPRGVGARRRRRAAPRARRSATTARSPTTTCSRCPTPVYSAWLGGNPEYDADDVRYEYTSLVSPTSAYDYDPATRTATLVKRQPVLGLRPRAVREPRGPGRPRPTAPGSRSRSCTGATSRTDGPEPDAALRLRLVRDVDRPDVLGVAASACSTAASCSRSRTSAAAASSGGAGTTTASSCTSATRSPTSSPAPSTSSPRARRQPRPPRRARRERRRAAHGRGGQPAARPLPRRRGRGAVRRLPHHHPRRDAPPHDHRVGGVGRPGRTTPPSTSS